MTEDQVLSPLTPSSWIVARLREDEVLAGLLGSGPFPDPNANWGAGNALLPVYKAGQVPPKHPARFVVVKPPLHHGIEYYACLAPRTMEATYLIWAEAQTDSLPAGLDLDGVLEPIFKRLIRALVHLQTTEAVSGQVLQVEIKDVYTPLPLDITEGVRVGQMGIELALISTVESS